MKNIIEIFLILLMAVAVYQDFRSRTLNVGLLILLFVGVIINGWLAIQPKLMFKHAAINMILFAIQILGVYLFYMIKYKGRQNILNKRIGAGDLLFIGILCCAFSPYNFILFLLIGFFLTITGFVISGLAKTPNQNTIPLAGWLAGCYIVLFIVTSYFVNYDIYSDLMIEQWMINLL